MCTNKIMWFTYKWWFIQVRKRSARKNDSFQKLFSLPAEEFLINDFACAIRRKILIQV